MLTPNRSCGFYCLPPMCRSCRSMSTRFIRRVLRRRAVMPSAKFLEILSAINSPTSVLPSTHPADSLILPRVIPGGFYRGPFGYGQISEDFDRRILQWMADGETRKLAGLSSAELLDHGEIELRSWIVLAGAVGEVPAQVLAYEPLYRGLMGMAVAQWPLNAAAQ